MDQRRNRIRIFYRREVIGGLSAVFLLLLYCFFFNVRPGDPANPQIVPESIKAPWYYLWVQEILSHFESPFLAGVIIPGFVFLILSLIAYYDSDYKNTKRRKEAVIFYLILIAIITLLSVIALFFRGPNWQFGFYLPEAFG
jgi:quinol-cytochrome oxidoreductase complex cytochrome b subunit